MVGIVDDVVVVVDDVVVGIWNRKEGNGMCRCEISVKLQGEKWKEWNRTEICNDLLMMFSIHSLKPMSCTACCNLHDASVRPKDNPGCFPRSHLSFDSCC